MKFSEIPLTEQEKIDKENFKIIARKTGFPTSLPWKSFGSAMGGAKDGTKS